MKYLAPILGVSAAILAVLVLMGRSRATAQAEAARTEISGLTNQIAQLQARLHGHETAGQLLQTNLDGRIGDLAATSNQLVRANAALQRSTAATRAVQDEVQERDRRLAEAAAAQAVLNRKIEELGALITGHDREILDAQQRWRAAEAARAGLQSELQRLQSDNDRLNRHLSDPVTLRSQLERAQKQSANPPSTAKPAAAVPKRNAKPRLELQPDGSVLLVPAGAGVAARP